MDPTCTKAFANCSETFESVPPAFARLGRLAAQRHRRWTIRFLPDAVPEHRWRAQTRRPLTRAEVAAGAPGAVYASTLPALEKRLGVQRLVAFMTATRGWRR